MCISSCSLSPCFSLMLIGAVACYCSSNSIRFKTRNFVQPEEFFEPYDSFRFFFDDLSDDDDVIYRNIASLGTEFEEAWKRILLADAVFVNTDRHMRNFGVMRSSRTGAVLRLAPNFDNNQAYLANPSGTYSDGMLKLYMKQADDRDYQNLKVLTDEMKKYQYDRTSCSRFLLVIIFKHFHNHARSRNKLKCFTLRQCMIRM